MTIRAQDEPPLARDAVTDPKAEPRATARQTLMVSNRSTWPAVSGLLVGSNGGSQSLTRGPFGWPVAGASRSTDQGAEAVGGWRGGAARGPGP